MKKGKKGAPLPVAMVMCALGTPNTKAGPANTRVQNDSPCLCKHSEEEWKHFVIGGNKWLAS